MDSDEKGAWPEAPQSSGTVNLHSDSITVEKLTILETTGPLLTKVYKSDGTVASYDDAASFRVKDAKVGNIDELHELLTDLEPLAKRCIIHGKFVGKETAVQANKPGTYARTNQNFIDQPLHSFMVDIDKYKPAFGDPVEEPEICILGYIEKILPKEFRGVSFHWQLSSSAGQASNRDVLKAHVWFYLETPRKCSELYEWAKIIGPQVDKVVYRRAQIHYTANPIFEEGREDPVPVRSGLFRGARDTLPLVIDDATLAQARDQGAGEGGHDMKVIDPSEKENLIGAFHRAFSAERVLSELLEGEFEQVTQRRWTWVNGGGTPEGVWVHDDDMHVGSSHNTWPVGSSLLNLWDLVRVFKFGHLDHSEDEFEQLNIDSLPLQAKPSSKAMYEFAEGLDEVRALLREERGSELRSWIAEIEKAEDIYILDQIVPRIQAAELSVAERGTLSALVLAKYRSFGPSRIKPADVDRMLAPARRTIMPDAPLWARDWVWVSDVDRFMNIKTKQQLTILSFNAQFDREIPPDVDGNFPKASEMALRVWELPVVAAAEYHPAPEDCYSPFFTRDGMEMLNTYRPDLLPKMPDHYSQADKIAIETIKLHAELLIPDERDRGLFLDFMAHNVQFPGKKIRWAPILIGMEGDGKTAFLTLMGAVLGSANFRILNNKTLGSDFTGWARGQCLIGVEEVKLHNSDRFDIFNALKPIISNDTIEVHPKGKDPVTLPNYSNLMLLTNHPDAMPVSSNDRRLFFLRSPFHNKEMLHRAILEKTGYLAREFHDQLFDVAIKKHTGALRKWLMEREFKNPDFQPNGRAPENEMRSEAIEMAKSDDEIAVSAVIESGAFGVYPTLIAGSLLTKAVMEQYDGLKLATHRLCSTMSNLGWQQFSDSARTWRGKGYRWYYRGDKPESVAVRADQLEKERKDKQIDGDFVD